VRASKVAAIGAALALAAVMSVLPLQVAGAQSPGTAVLIPSNGATVSGSTVLDASASNATTVVFVLFGGTYGLNGQLLCTATATLYGWLCAWNTIAVPNGNYTLVSLALGADGYSFSGGVSITVDNAPPSTTVIIPVSGATLDSSVGGVIDAVASPGVTKVSIELSIAGATETIPTVPTIYGWVAVFSATQPCAQCTRVSVPGSIQSVASYPGGVSGTSPAVSLTFIDYLLIVEP
jgi:Bacterial Ig domain